MSPVHMRILVTAGPTREFIDPIRFISNLSTGNIGYAIAKKAREKGHRVTLVSGPVSIQAPKGVKIINATTAEDMFYAVKKEFKNSDCLIMAAAVCDFKPQRKAAHKIKKQASSKRVNLQLVRNPDILLWVSRHKGKRITAGFCLETKNLLQEAKRKLQEKYLDIVIANKIEKDINIFGSGRTKILMLERDGTASRIGPVAKDKVADILLDKTQALWYKIFNDYGNKI